MDMDRDLGIDRDMGRSGGWTNTMGHVPTTSVENVISGNLGTGSRGGLVGRCPPDRDTDQFILLLLLLFVDACHIKRNYTECVHPPLAVWGMVVGKSVRTRMAM